MTDPLKAALEAAGDALWMACAPDELPLVDDCQPGHREMCRQAAAAIAAFHRQRASDCRAAGMMTSAMLHDDLAAAVEAAAAREGGG